MAYVVTENCINCKHTNCAAICPVDAFREGPNFLTIDPFECIDCDACVSECPVEAIYADDEVPDEWSGYIELNERLSDMWSDRVITEAKTKLSDAEKWAYNFPKHGYLLYNWNNKDIYQSEND